MTSVRGKASQGSGVIGHGINQTGNGGQVSGQNIGINFFESICPAVMNIEVMGGVDTVAGAGNSCPDDGAHVHT